MFDIYNDVLVDSHIFWSINRLQLSVSGYRSRGSGSERHICVNLIKHSYGKVNMFLEFGRIVLRLVIFNQNFKNMNQVGPKKYAESD